MKNVKVAIRYGVVCGPAHGKRFRAELQKAGYKYVKRLEEADIIVAHSAGCFWLPEAPTKQRLLMIDPPYWPGRSIGERAWRRLRTSVQFRKYGYSFFYWLEHYLWYFFYSVKDAPRTWRIIKTAPKYDLALKVKNQRAILVRNDDDDWLSPDLDSLRIINPHLIIKKLPGEHEDCWHNPKPYVKLLQLLV